MVSKLAKPKAQFTKQRAIESKHRHSITVPYPSTDASKLAQLASAYGKVNSMLHAGACSKGLAGLSREVGGCSGGACRLVKYQ